MQKLLFAGVILGALPWMGSGCRKEIRYQPPPPVTGEKISDVKEAWIQLYDKEGFQGKTFTVRFQGTPQDHPNFREVFSDNGLKGFNDEAAAVKWQIPESWSYVLYDGFNFQGSRFPLIGTGKVEMNPGPLPENASSGRWERKN